jgi:hypothetical protein
MGEVLEQRPVVPQRPVQHPRVERAEPAEQHQPRVRRDGTRRVQLERAELAREIDDRPGGRPLRRIAEPVGGAAESLPLDRHAADLTRRQLQRRAHRPSVQERAMDAGRRGSPAETGPARTA